jgi:flagellar motility protein MotE (MotC chaperone)
MKRAGRGALVILALFLAASGALRIGGIAGEAMANAKNDPELPAPTTPAECPQPPTALLAALNERDAQVRVQEAALADRMAALLMADAAITTRLTELAEAEASLTEVLAIADGAAEQDIARLTAVYEAMKPVDAAALFNAMDPEFAAGFLGRMQPSAAAAVLAGMAPDNAYSISVLIAGRNALAPKD